MTNMTKSILFALALIAIIAAVNKYARAANICFGIGVLEKFLVEKHGERLVGQGVVGDKVMYGLFVSPETGAFTIVRVDLNTRTSCMASSGRDWQFVKPTAHAGDPS